MGQGSAPADASSASTLTPSYEQLMARIQRRVAAAEAHSSPAPSPSGGAAAVPVPAASAAASTAMGAGAPASTGAAPLVRGTGQREGGAGAAVSTPASANERTTQTPPSGGHSAPDAAGAQREAVKAAVQSQMEGVGREERELLRMQEDLGSTPPREGPAQEAARLQATADRARGDSRQGEHAAPPPQSGSGAVELQLSKSAPAALNTQGVHALFARHGQVLARVLDHYRGASAGLTLPQFVSLANDYDISPTFLRKSELRSLFLETARAYAKDPVTARGKGLTLQAFLELLARAAIRALDKPAFSHLYPTAEAKVGVLLEMWAVADAEKLAEVATKDERL